MAHRNSNDVPRDTGEQDEGEYDAYVHEHVWQPTSGSTDWHEYYDLLKDRSPSPFPADDVATVYPIGDAWAHLLLEYDESADDDSKYVPICPSVASCLMCATECAQCKTLSARLAIWIVWH